MAIYIDIDIYLNVKTLGRSTWVMNISQIYDSFYK